MGLGTRFISKIIKENLAKKFIPDPGDKKAPDPGSGTLGIRMFIYDHNAL
jgi:hypothetical protein